MLDSVDNNVDDEAVVAGEVKQNCVKQKQKQKQKQNVESWQSSRRMYSHIRKQFTLIEFLLRHVLSHLLLALREQCFLELLVQDRNDRV